jgi:hypothetical protein
MRRFLSSAVTRPQSAISISPSFSWNSSETGSRSSSCSSSRRFGTFVVRRVRAAQAADEVAYLHLLHEAREPSIDELEAATGR